MSQKVQTPRDVYQQTLMQLMSCRPMAYWPILARKLGAAKAAIMMSQLLYWNGDQTVQKRDGWVYKTIEQMTDETGLVKSEQATARRLLLALGVIDAERHGVPPIWYYRVNFDRLTEILISEETQQLRKSTVEKVNEQESSPTNVKKPNNQKSRKSPDKSEESLPILIESETTSETTYIDYTETTSSSSNPAQQEEEGFKNVFSESEIEALKSIGLFEEKIDEVAQLVIEKDVNEEELAAMIRAAKQKEPEFGKTAALLLYRLRQMPAAAAIAKSDEVDRRSYAVPGVTQ